MFIRARAFIRINMVSTCVLWNAKFANKIVLELAHYDQEATARGIAESGSSQLSILMTEKHGDLV